MALWGAFGIQENKAESACRSALAQMEKIRELQKVFAEKLGFALHVRMGIHMGSAIVGNIGSLGKKIEFTAIGDTINTASRLEGINKQYGTGICVSKAIVDATGDNFIFRKLDLVRVKGKNEVLEIYELLGEKTEANKMLEQLKTDFEAGLTLYCAGDIERAREIFTKILVWKKDPASEVFVQRCETLLETGLPDDWNGIYTATEK